MGDFVKDVSQGQNKWLQGAYENTMKGNVVGQAEDMGNAWAYIMDPGGLFNQSGDKGLAQAQKGSDIGGFGAKPAQEAAAAEKSAAKQKALIASQNAKIEEERKKQQRVADERSARMSKNQLLSGSETGTTSLLGGL